MKTESIVFLDTAFVYALVNTRDQWHEKAMKWQDHLSKQNCLLHTTEFVLTEIVNGLSAIRFRDQAVKIIDYLIASPDVVVTPASAMLFESGMKLFRLRMDKDWGLTDCISFRTMEQNGIRSALTTDEHFRQAGFRALLLED